MRHPNLAERDDTCLVVVDMQAPFLMSMFGRDRVVENVTKLIGVAKILGLPIVTTLQYPERMGESIPEVKDLIPDAPAVGKMTFSCCGAPEFVQRVEELKRGTVVLCGVETHICVSQTAHDLMALGYRVHVPEDAVCSRKETDWRSGLAKMGRSGAIVTCSESVIYELLERSGTEEFKQTLKLVK